MKGDSDDSSAGLASYVCNAVTGCEYIVASNAVIVTVEESSISSVSSCIVIAYIRGMYMKCGYNE